MGSLDQTVDRLPEGGAGVPWLVELHDWLVTVDHKRIGIMYVLTSLLFFLIAGLMAIDMRVQLTVPNNHYMSPQVFNRMFTMHGTTMIFLVATPMIVGIANYLVPLMIGARDLAFPRLNALGYWLFLFGTLFLYYSYIGGGGVLGAGSAPAVGWFAYSPLTSRTFARGSGVDYWIIGLLLSGTGTTMSAINLVTTIFTMRCKGMTLGKMPLMVWLNLVAMCLIVVAFPALSAAQVMLLFDRMLGAHFFDPQAGGAPLLWQHFFWIFGHPEVYIVVLPPFGYASEIIAVFSRKVIFGYPMMVAATVAIGFISLSVWAHHMFAVGMAAPVNAFFVGSTLLIAVPTGIKMFNWVATMFGGRIRFTVPMLFAVAFLFQFLIAGLTGVMLAVAPFDWQLTDSYFVVAHFHYVLVGAILFNIFGAIYYWFPKVTGKMLDEYLGRWHFWLLVIGFNLTFAPMHVAGLLGMARRVYTYQAGRGLEIWNVLSTIGAFMQLVAIAFFLWNLVRSLHHGEKAGDDPWDAWTLEWSTTSPPPEYNFETLPTVMSRRPLWDLKHPEDPDWRFE